VKEARRQVEEARRHTEDLKRKAKWAAEEATSNAAKVLTQHKQELANLQLVHEKLTERNPRMDHGDLVVVLAEKVDDFENVNVISMGSLSILIGRLSVSAHSSLLRSQVSGHQCSTEITPTRWLVLHETLVRTTDPRERRKATSR
jgi:transcription elongation GreA/GreB family factor